MLTEEEFASEKARILSELSHRLAGVAYQGLSTLFQAAFRDSRNAMVLADDARRIVDVNGACLQLLG